MYLDLEDDGLSKTLFYRGVHEPLATAWVRREVEPGMPLVDVGANLGYYALLESAGAGPGGRVHALEPVPTTYELLCRNLELNRVTNVEAHCLALAADPGPMTMRLPRRRNWAHLPHPALSSARARRLAALPHREVAVEATSLDAFVRDQGIRSLHFLRMDIEGFEIEVVKGAMHTLSRHRPLKVLMELHPFLSDDAQPFVELVTALDEAGLAVRYLAQEEELVAEWPRLEDVLRYLDREPVAAAPHLLLEAVR